MRRNGARVVLPLACAGALALGLAGCGERTREVFGIDRPPPDEFAVLTRAPLAIPPDFGLRPPRPGTPRPQERDVKDEARNILLRSARTADAGNGTTRSSGEQALLGRAGATDADPSIRREVDQESGQIAEADRSFVDKLIFWRNREPPGVVVDADRESQRLRGNAALGTPSTSGTTPVIKRRVPGFLEGLFN